MRTEPTRAEQEQVAVAIAQTVASAPGELSRLTAAVYAKWPELAMRPME